MRNGELGFWHASLGGAGPTRPALGGPTEADVCIVGAGYTGLWTAWALRQAEPAIRIVVVDRAHVGFGASGRNGGWLSGFLPGDREVMARGGQGRAGVIALQRALHRAVDQVAGICEAEGIDADLHKGGSLTVATSPAQLARLRSKLAAARVWGVGPEDAWELGQDEVEGRVRVAGALGALFSPHCARIQPAKLVRGLATAVERRGVEIYEATPVETIRPHVAQTAFGDVSARWVVRATEGFTAGLPGLGRQLLPMNSSMIVTEPLGPQRWAEIGWRGAETLADGAHAYLYAQRTLDGRIAIGGRGVPYRFASRTDHRGVTPAKTAGDLAAGLHRLLPAARGIDIAHAWCGVLGVARDWCPSVGVDRHSGLAWAGGYAGDGVTAAHLAGLTLADLIVGADTERTRMPWVGHESRPWEPEPLRWAGVRGIYHLYRAADRAETAGRNGTSMWARVAGRISGRA
jgi:glycine/D-amino acid oxidase-like deaminating enzyme